MNDFEYLPGSVPIGRITYDLSQPDDSPPYLVGYADTRGGSFLIRSLDRIDEQIADLVAGRKLLADALDRWYAPKAGALPVRESLAEHRARLGGDIGPLEPLPPTEYSKPEPFVPLVHYLADDETMPCGAQSAPGLTVTATTDPADVTCGLCATSAECREAAESRPYADPFAGDVTASQPDPDTAAGCCIACELDADPGTGPLGHTYSHTCRLGPHCGAEGCGGQDCDCRDDCGHPMCQMADPGDEPAALPGAQEAAFGRFADAHDAEDARVDAGQAQAGAE